MSSRRVLPEGDGQARPYEPEAPRSSPAEMTLEERYAEAEKRGYRDGVARGRDEARGEAAIALEQARSRLARALADLQGLEASVRREAEGELVRLAVEIASRIVRARVSEDEAVVQRSVRAALEEAAGRDPRILRLHPDDLEAVRDACPELAEPRGLRLVPDASVEPGGCLLELAGGEVDARLESQIDAVAERLGLERGP